MKAQNSQDYYKAAVFYLEENLDINMAKSWIDKCFELRKRPSILDVKPKSFDLFSFW